MALSTCFLPHFPRSLQGRAKPSGSSQITRKLRSIRDRSLPDLEALLGGLLTPAFFAKAPDNLPERQRTYPPITVFWAFLCQTLNPAMPCREIVSKVRAWHLARGTPARPPALGTSAYCDARCALSLRLVQAAFHELRDYLDRRADSAWLWCGRRVKVIDGSSVSMPDTEANQRQWPQPRTQSKGCGFPVAKVLGLFCLSTGGWLGHALSKWRSHDLSLWSALRHLLVRGDILLGDAGFCSYALRAELKARGVDTVFRLHQARSKDMRKGRRLGKEDRLQVWTKPRSRPSRSPWEQEAWDQLPEQLEVRIVRVRISRKGFRTRCLWIATTLTDAKQYPSEALAELYHRRWSIELFLRDVKTSMGMEVLRTKSPEMIRKELFMHAIAYNAIRALILQSASEHHQQLGQISFKGTVDLLRQWLPHAAACRNAPRKLESWQAQLREAIAELINPLRPERREPRARKRRPKSYQLLTSPRHQFKEIPHREHYRKSP